MAWNSGFWIPGPALFLQQSFPIANFRSVMYGRGSMDFETRKTQFQSLIQHLTHFSEWKIPETENEDKMGIMASGPEG